MLGALAGLPSLGGLGGGFGGGMLPMLGLGLLSTLTSQLTTQSFLGSPTGIPDLNSTLSAGNFNYNFGSYTGTGASASNGFDMNRLQSGPSDYRAWHQWATGAAPPPVLQPAPLSFEQPYYQAQAYGYGQGYGFNQGQTVYGTSGSYNYGQSYGMAGAYPPPAFPTYSNPVQYGAAPHYPSPAPAPAYPQPPAQQPNYVQTGYVDVTYRIPTFEQAPQPQAYQPAYQSMPAPPQYGSYTPQWNYPSYPYPNYMPAMPSYTQQVLQQQSPYGYGGPTRPAPSTPPAAPPKPKPPVAYNPPKPTKPATPPTPPTPPAPPTLAPRSTYPLVPRVTTQDQITADWNEPARLLGSRMTGDPGKIGTLTSVTPPPIHARDASQFDRMSAYYVMNQDDSLRLDVDRGKFYRTFGDKKIDVLDLSHVSTMLRQYQGDGYQRVGDLLGHLPTDQQLAATLPKPAPTPTYGNPQPTNNYGKPVSQPPTNYGTPVAYYPPTQPPPAPTPPTPPAPPAPPATPKPPVVVQQPPAPQPHPPVLGNVINGTFVPSMPFLPSREPLPNSGGAVPALDKLVADRNAGTISGNDFNLELLRIAQQTGAIRTNVNNVGPARTGDFNLTAHRYWDSASGGYVNVSEILLSGGINPNDELRVFNPQGQNTLSLNRENVPLGNNMRVTVSWENGQQRVWDYQLREVGDTSVDVFTPAG